MFLHNYGGRWNTTLLYHIVVSTNLQPVVALEDLFTGNFPLYSQTARWQVLPKKVFLGTNPTKVLSILFRWYNLYIPYALAAIVECN